jgi:hypothetical protein
MKPPTPKNGAQLPCGAGLIGALTFFGCDAMDAMEKEAMRKLAQRGGPWTDAEKAALIDYCAKDVVSLAELLGKPFSTSI